MGSWLAGCGSFAAPLRLRCGMQPYLKLIAFVRGSRDISRFKISIVFKFVQGTILRTPLKSSTYGLLYKLSLPHPSSLHAPFPNHNHILHRSTRPSYQHTKLYTTSHSSAVLPVYPQVNSVLSIYVSLANNLLTAVYRPQNSLSRPPSPVHFHFRAYHKPFAPPASTLHNGALESWIRFPKIGGP